MKLTKKELNKIKEKIEEMEKLRTERIELNLPGGKIICIISNRHPDQERYEDFIFKEIQSEDGYVYYLSR